jgi:hypothetical protein
MHLGFMALILVVSALPGSAGAPPVEWIKAYRDTGNDYGYWIEECSTGGYVVTGATEDVEHGTPDLFLMRLDGAGDTLWVKVYGDDLYQTGSCVRETGDGFLIAGYTETASTGMDAYLLKTDCDGDTLWTRAFDFDGDDFLYCLKELEDRSLMTVGFTSGLGSPSLTDILILKTDADGYGLWKEYYEGPGNDRAGEVIQTSDGECVLVGFSEDAAGDSDVFLMKFNSSDGDSIWTRTYGDTTRDLGSAVWETASGDLIVGGGMMNYAQGWGKSYLVRTDSRGDSIWSRTYGDTAGDQYIYSVAETPDQGIVCGARCDPTGSGDSDFLFFKTEAKGDTMWTSMVGDGDHQSPVCMIPTSDNGFVAAGFTRPISAGERDIYLVKLRSDVAGVIAQPEPVGHDPLAIEGPNPATGRVTVRYDVAGASEVRLEVYDVAGRHVTNLAGGKRETGSYRAVWDCTDHYGKPVSPGVYLVRFESGERLSSRKVLVLR